MRSRDEAVAEEFPYRLTTVLREDGAFRDYEARHLRTGRRCVVRFLQRDGESSSEVSDEPWLCAWREAGSVRSPHLVSLLDSGRRGGVAYVVLDLARQADHEVAETALTVDDLLDADEVFVTNSGFELVPVVHIERRPIGREKPGPLTTKLPDRYRAEVIADTDSSAPPS